LLEGIALHVGGQFALSAMDCERWAESHIIEYYYFNFAQNRRFKWTLRGAHANVRRSSQNVQIMWLCGTDPTGAKSMRVRASSTCNACRNYTFRCFFGRGIFDYYLVFF